jgi:PPOX class probable F420-dependent enzyme
VGVEIELDKARAYLTEKRQAVLATIKRDGRPQLSNVLFVLDPNDGRIKVSVTQTRAKTHNLRRDPRATLHVPGKDFWQYLVIEGEARLIEGEGVLEAMRDYYRKARGEHPNWEEYDAAMVRDQRLLLSISVDRAYGQLP